VWLYSADFLVWGPAIELFGFEYNMQWYNMNITNTHHWMQWRRPMDKEKGDDADEEMEGEDNNSSSSSMKNSGDDNEDEDKDKDDGYKSCNEWWRGS